MSNIHFYTIFPNLWFSYFDINADMVIISAQIKKLAQAHGISSIIRCDKDTSFWNKSNGYIADIKAQMILDEIDMLIKYYDAKCSIIKSNYYGYKPTLIISNNVSLETSIGLLAHFLKIYANMGIKDALKLVEDKLGLNSKNGSLILSDAMIRLLQLKI